MDSHLWTGPQFKPDFGHTHNFCTCAPTHLASRTDCTSKGLCLDWCPSSTTGSLVWLQKMGSSGSLPPPMTRSSPHKGHPHRLQGFSGAIVFHIAPKPSNSSHHLSTLSLHWSLPHLILPVPNLTHSQSICKISPSSTSQGDPCIPLKPSLFLSLYRPVDCSMSTVLFLYS